MGKIIDPRCKVFCTCAKEAMARGANRDWVDGLEDQCPHRSTNLEPAEPVVPKLKRMEAEGDGEIEVKRFSLPIVIKVNCPKCETLNEYDFNDNYLSYPTLNKPESIEIYCIGCEDYFSHNVTLKIAIEY